MMKSSSNSDSSSSSTAAINIVVGSENPVKVNAAISGAEKVFGIEKGINCVGFEVSSGVADQPLGDEETKSGAINRAKNAYHAYLQKYSTAPAFAIGMEGGVALIRDDTDSLGHPMECFAWIAVFDGQQIGVARTASFTLPNLIRDLIMEEGMELGDADDHVFGSTNSKRAGGTVGHLTSGIITRSSYYEHAIILAFIPFQWSTLYFPSRGDEKDRGK